MPLLSYPTIAAIGDNIDRINALYSPFRAKSLNPEHYNEKLKFWVKCIEEFSTVDTRMVFSIKDLEVAFRVDGRVSACIPDVVEHLQREGILVGEEEYLASLKSQSWWSWSTKPLRSAASAMWNMTPLSVITQKKLTKETRLVYVPQLSTQASSILLQTHLQNQLMTLGEWKEKVGQLIHPGEVELLLEYLKASGHIATDKLGETEVIKLIVPTPGRQMGITAAEKGQFDICRTKDKLEKDLEAVFHKQQLAENQAKTALKDGQRATAKYHLKTKKTYERRAQKLCALIDNLSVIMFQIEDAQSDGRILAAYEAGKQALGKVLKENNINVDRTTDLMMDLQEMLEDQAEVSTQLGRDIVEEDTTLLEDELDQLLLVEEEEEREKEKEAKGTGKKVSTPVSENNTYSEEDLKLLAELNLEDLDDLKPPSPSNNLSSSQA